MREQQGAALSSPVSIPEVHGNQGRPNVPNSTPNLLNQNQLWSGPCKIFVRYPGPKSQCQVKTQKKTEIKVFESTFINTRLEHAIQQKPWS